MAEIAVSTADREIHHETAHHGPQGIMKYLWSTDHKVIAMQYLFTGMAMGVLGGLRAYVFRMQLAFPGMSVPGCGEGWPGEGSALASHQGSSASLSVAMPGP